MIRAIWQRLWPPRLSCDSAPMHDAVGRLEAAVVKVHRAAYDDIGRSFGVEGPYSDEKVGLAVRDVVRRYHEAHRRDP